MAADVEQKAARPHGELIRELLDSRIPKSEREHAAAREIERLRADAERYRWLRERMVAEEIVNKAYAVIALRVVGPIAKRPADPEYCGELDAVIDQARGGCGEWAALDAAKTDQQQAKGGQTNA